MQLVDWLVIAACFLVLVWIVWRSRRLQAWKDHCLAGREIGWFVVGCSLLASNIRSEHIVGLGCSLATPPPPAGSIVNVTYSSLRPEQKAENRRSWGAGDVWGTAAVLALLLGAYWYFSFWLE